MKSQCSQKLQAEGDLKQTAEKALGHEADAGGMQPMNAADSPQKLQEMNSS